MGRPRPATDDDEDGYDEEEEDEEEPAPRSRRGAARAAVARDRWPRRAATTTTTRSSTTPSCCSAPHRRRCRVRKPVDPPEHSPLPTRAEQLAITGWPATTSCRRPTCSKPAPRPKTRSKANDEVIAALPGRLRAVRRGRRGHRLHPRPDGHPVRGRAGPRREGRADHPAVPQHRLRGEVAGRADPQPDPGQERGRRRDPQHRPGGRGARRRAALAGRHLRPPPDGGRARQGHRGRVRRRQPGEDAAHPHRRRDRRRQVVAASTRCSSRS